MTEKLYYTSPETLDFQATVTGATPAGNMIELTLDRTAFYPEGGGQPADLGSIAGLAVVDVQKRDGEVVHMVQGAADPPADAPPAPAVGETVECAVDAARRRDYMQQHTGQHIISAALLTAAGANTVSVHLGEDYSTIEVDRDSLTPEELRAVEDLANASIESATPIETTWVDDSEIGSYSLRRPPKVKGSIRLVTIDGVDCVACGGVHVANTAQVRMVRAIGTETIRGRVRTSWKIGDRALSDYYLAGSVVSAVGDVLSAQPAEIPDRVRRQEERIRELESAAKKGRERIARLNADALLASEEPVSGRRVITAEFADEEKDFLREVCKVLSSATGVAACLVNNSAGQLQWCITLSPACGVELTGLRENLLPLIDGKGGGKPPMWQGVGMKPAGAGAFLRTFREMSGK